MRPVALIGILLVVLGVAGLVFSVFTYKTEDQVAKVGPLTATAEHEHTVYVPPYAGVIAIVVGGALVFAGRRRV